MMKRSLLLLVAGAIFASPGSFAETIKDYKILVSIKVNKIESDKIHADVTFYTTDNSSNRMTNVPFVKGSPMNGESSEKYFLSFRGQAIKDILQNLFHESAEPYDPASWGKVGISKRAAKDAQRTPAVINIYSAEGSMIAAGRNPDFNFNFPDYSLPEPTLPPSTPTPPQPQVIKVQAHFALNQYNLDQPGSNGKRPRDEVNEALRQSGLSPNDYQSFVVIGYASPDNTDAAAQQSDLTLSQGRAEVVAQMMRQMGFKNVKAEGKGQTMQFSDPAAVADWLKKRKAVRTSSPQSIAEMNAAKEKALSPNRVIIIQKN